MWYALVQDEQLGPMPDAELVELYLKGVVADQTLVWNANLPDWQPFSDVPELVELAGGEELEAEEEGDGATIMMADDTNWAALLAQGRPPVQVSRSQPLPDARSSISMVAPRDVPTPERMLPPAGLAPQQAPVGRSGMFQAVQEPVRPAPPPPEPEPEDAFGGFGGFDAPPPMVDLADLPEQEPGRTVAPGFTTAARTPPGGGGRKGLLVAAFILVIGGLGAGGTIWYLRQGPTALADAGVPAAATTEGDPVVVPSPDAALPPPDAAPPPPVDAAVPDAATDAMVFALLEVPDPPKDPPRTPETAAPRAPSTRAPATRAPAAAPRTQAPRPPPAGDLPRQLGRQDMLDVIQANAGRLKSCADADPNAKGTFTVAVTINRSGAVQQAKVVTARLRGSAATACIEGQIKSYKFKPFAGDPMRLQIPFKI